MSIIRKNVFNLKTKLFLGFGLPLVAMAAVAVVVYQNIEKLQSTSKWVNHTHEAINYGQGLLMAMIDMETGLRGYLVSGKAEFLEPYEGGQRNFSETVAAAKMHVSDNQGQVTRLEQIEELKEEWITNHASPAIALRNEVVANAEAVSRFKELSARTVGKQLFDTFRAELAKLDSTFEKSGSVNERSLLQRILRDMINKETGQRGFLLTGKEESLEPFVEGERQIVTHVAQLKAIIDSSYSRTDALMSLNQLESTVIEWKTEVVANGIALKRESATDTNSESALQKHIASGIGKKYFDSMRVIIDSLHAQFQSSNDLVAVAQLTAATKSMVDMETGYRGFLLTGVDTSLEPYNSGEVEFVELVNDLKARVNSAYEPQAANAQVEKIASLTRSWVDDAAMPEIQARREMNRVTTTIDDVTAFIETGQGKLRMDGLRVLLAKFIDEEKTLIDKRSIEAQRVATQTEIFTIGGTSFAILFGVLVTLLVIWGVLRQLGGDPSLIKSIAEQIAKGDLTTDLHARRNTTGVLAAMIKMRDNLLHSVETEKQTSEQTDRLSRSLEELKSGVIVADSNNKIVYANEAAISLFRAAQGELRAELPQLDANNLLGSNVESLFPNPAEQKVTLENLTQSISIEFTVSERTLSVTSSPLKNHSGVSVGTAHEWRDRTDEVALENALRVEVQGLVDAAKRGELDRRIDLHGKTGLLEVLSVGMNDLVVVTEQVVNDITRVLGALSRGDLGETIESQYEGSFDQLKTNANTTVTKLADVMGKISNGTDSVSVAAGELAKGNKALSTRTEQQAASLEETTSSMEEMTTTVHQNAENAQKASELAASTSEHAQISGRVVNQAMLAVDAITESSTQIADIVNVIDEIAFQTNLLALNASVEAARAGEQGRGFAVVAAEVRNLAGRSATAAKEIKELIDDSVTKVGDGAKLVKQSGTMLEEIVERVNKVTGLVTEIADASQEQSLGISQVNRAIVQMDNMTQQNATLVGEAASSSMILGDQAHILREEVSFFDSRGYSSEDNVVEINAQRHATGV